MALPAPKLVVHKPERSGDIIDIKTTKIGCSPHERTSIDQIISIQRKSIEKVETKQSPLNQVVEPLMILRGALFREEEVKERLQPYFDSLLPTHLKHSFAPLDALIESMSSSYDPHYLIYTSTTSTIQGLVAFNVDTMV